MSELKLENIKPFDEMKPGTDFIFIRNAGEIPPHIGLVLDDRYYASSVSGVKTGIDFSVVLKNCIQKKTPCLFVSLEKVELKMDVAAVFNNYGRLDAPEKSCLFPIIDVLEKTFEIKLKCEFIFVLIPELKENKKCGSIFQLHMDEMLTDKSFVLPKYSRNEIGFCINQLNDKQPA